MAQVENKAARLYQVDQYFIKPLETVTIPDEIITPLMEKEYFKAWASKDLEVRLDHPEPNQQVDHLGAFTEGPALALARAEENPPTLRRWAKKEKRETVREAIESRLKELG